MKPKDRIDSILLELALYKKLLPQASKSASAVSGWNVGQHIEHVLKANKAGIKFLKDGPPPELKLFPAPFRTKAVLFLGFIPRGKGKSPQHVLPTAENFDGLPERFAECEHGFQDLKNSIDEIVEKKGFLPHPILGGLTYRQWLRFMEVHQHHHYKIVMDILRAAG